jgi:predicted AlkP superfamily phosphohydrolase/phosphomutase/Tfp pilus assembly protein PilF
LSKPRVLLVALEGATPAVASALLDTGDLPCLAHIVEGGCSGMLRASSPLVRSMLCTTLATGQRAPRHGVCGDVSVRADGAGVQRTNHRVWQAPAVWEVLASAGFSTAVVGWPATVPASSWSSGLIIDDSFSDPSGRDFQSWPLRPDCVFPRDLRKELRGLRVHPTDITGSQIAAFVPQACRVDQDSDARLTRIAVALARSSTVHAVATYIAAQCEWDFLAVAYSMLGDFQREFLALCPPLMDGVDERDTGLYGNVVDAAYRVQDAMLGALLACIDPSTTVVIASPYGFAAGADRPSSATALPPSIAWHRHHGLIAAKGKGIEPDTLTHAARVEDVAPSILYMFGLEAAWMDGRALEALAKKTVTVDVPCPPSQGTIENSPLVKGDLTPSQRQIVEQTTAAWLGNTAEAYLAHQDFANAASAYERIIEVLPDNWVAKARLASCRFHLGDLESCRALAEELIGSEPDRPWGYLLGAAGLGFDARTGQASEYLAEAFARGRNLPNVLLRLAMLHLARNEPSEAEARFREALEIMPGSVEACDGLGTALLAQNRIDEAIAAFKAGIGATFHYPLTHVHLALALASTRRWDEALQSVRIALSQDPLIAGGAALLDRILDAMGADEALRRGSRGKASASH